MHSGLVFTYHFAPLGSKLKPNIYVFSIYIVENDKGLVLGM